MLYEIVYLCLSTWYIHMVHPSGTSTMHGMHMVSMCTLPTPGAGVHTGWAYGRITGVPRGVGISSGRMSIGGSWRCVAMATGGREC